MGEIMAASQEQSSGIEQVNQAIGQMDQVTQQNAALVEEATAAAQSLQDQAGKLAQVVSAFRLDARRAPPAPAVTVPPRVPPAKPKAVPAVAATQPLPPPVAAPERRKLVRAPVIAGDEWEEF